MTNAKSTAAPNSTETPAPARKLLGYAIILDFVLVLVFAVSGRASHAESLSIGGVAWTAWPFLAALLLGWLVTRNWRSPILLWPNGVCIWLITLAGGMALRVLSGETAAIPFVIVATLVLGLFLLGHRIITALVIRSTTRR
ncbi:DUF3054 domain-containing protein [Arthrobacter cryoconiti]|uniref:DUF3054 domain-containing protein n=1 Tax=Arthrobacter cryoconiti TaxID=748907 RepID=A0ABV8QX30_9MICC|nr:DUF3054 domain-containing protein [Arthrobacter cryoconiti]MCC9069528.1 DUF3054 domain-containing protein [Arthrobacter cryoconiti]